MDRLPSARAILGLGTAPLGERASELRGPENEPSAAAADAAPADERRRIEALLVEHGGVVARAAADLGLSRQALYRRMERLGIVLERRPRS